MRVDAVVAHVANAVAVRIGLIGVVVRGTRVTRVAEAVVVAVQLQRIARQRADVQAVDDAVDVLVTVVPENQVGCRGVHGGDRRRAGQNLRIVVCIERTLKPRGSGCPRRSRAFKNVVVHLDGIVVLVQHDLETESSPGQGVRNVLPGSEEAAEWRSAIGTDVDGSPDRRIEIIPEGRNERLGDQICETGRTQGRIAAVDTRGPEIEVAVGADICLRIIASIELEVEAERGRGCGFVGQGRGYGIAHVAFPLRLQRHDHVRCLGRCQAWCQEQHQNRQDRRCPGLDRLMHFVAETLYSSGIHPVLLPDWKVTVHLVSTMASMAA